MRKSPSAFCAGYLDAGQLCSGTGFLELGARVYYNHHPCNTARPAALARLPQPQQAGRRKKGGAQRKPLSLLVARGRQAASCWNPTLITVPSTILAAPGDKALLIVKHHTFYHLNL